MPQEEEGTGDVQHLASRPECCLWSYKDLKLVAVYHLISDEDMYYYFLLHQKSRVFVLFA